jgi:hypothetical protein
MTIRNIVLAGVVVIGAALSAGTASASPASAILGAPAATTAETALQQAYYPGGHYNYGFRRLCRLPFFVLVQRFGYWRAKMIKRNCYRTHYPYGYGY